MLESLSNSFRNLFSPHVTDVAIWGPTSISTISGLFQNWKWHSHPFHKGEKESRVWTPFLFFFFYTIFLSVFMCSECLKMCSAILKWLFYPLSIVKSSANFNWITRILAKENLNYIYNSFLWICSTVMQNLGVGFMEKKKLVAQILQLDNIRPLQRKKPQLNYIIKTVPVNLQMTDCA